MTTKRKNRINLKDYIFAGIGNGFPLQTVTNYVVSSKEVAMLRICLRKIGPKKAPTEVYIDTNTLTVSELVSIMQPIPNKSKRLNTEGSTDDLIQIIIDAVQNNTFIIPKGYVNIVKPENKDQGFLLFIIHAFLRSIKTSIRRLEHPDIDSNEYAKEGIDFLGEAVRLTKLYNVLTEMSTLNKSSDTEKMLKCEKLYETAKVLFEAELSI